MMISKATSKGIQWARYLPILEWAAPIAARTRQTIMLIPQSFAYATLAGIPSKAGLYASIVPTLLYDVFGTSRSLAVGPVAVVSLMTAAAIADVTTTLNVGYAAAAHGLAGLSGIILLLMGILRLGFVANFFSHLVISGFITASGILIAVIQLKHVMGIDAEAHKLLETGASIVERIGASNLLTLVLGASVIVFLFWFERRFGPFGSKLACARARQISWRKRARFWRSARQPGWSGPYDLNSSGVRIMGAVPQSLPPFPLPDLSFEVLSALFVPALPISIIGFVESISVAQRLATKKWQRIGPDQELIGLGFR